MFEFDGPRSASFLCNGSKVTYITYAIASTDNPGGCIQHAISHIEDLSKLGIVVWRRRPELVWNEEDNSDTTIPPIPARWTITYRCATIPFIEDTKMLSKVEGHMISNYLSI